MALTSTQISQLRLLATDANPPFLVTAEEVGILYTQASSDTNTTVYNLMALMKSRLSDMLLRAGDKRQADWLDRRIDALCERMKFYEDSYSIGSTMTVTTADLGIDTDADSVTDWAGSPFWGWQ